MAAALALAALGPAIEIVKLVSKPIIRQCNYLCCFTTNISGLEEEAKKLDDALAGLKGEVERKGDDNEDPVPEVETWLNESKEIQVEINLILNEVKPVKSGGCSKLGARFSLSKKAKKKTESTKELRDGKPSAQFLPRPNAATQKVQLGDTFECESRNEIEEAIMKTLGGEDKKMIGIYGMGGLGKTTMAKKLMNTALKKDENGGQLFQEAVIATVSQTVDISKIQDEIGGQLGLDKLKEQKSESGRAQLLLSRLSDTKRPTLLVLDDVWETPPLESIGIPHDSKWCRILFTSRNRDVLNAMDDVKIFGMEVLSKEEAWSFFRERAGACVDDWAVNPIAEQVAKECGRLPLALDVVGVGLRHQHSVAIWENALQELQQRVPDTVQFDNKKVYYPLKLSYKGLDSEAAKSIFLLCCLFPEDADIPLEYLTYFCTGLHIFERVTNMGAARNRMCALTQKLKDRSLLLESDKEDCVRMHDVVRDVCTLIAKEEGYIGKDGCTWISSSHLVGEGNVLLSGSSCPNLRLLFLDSTYGDSLGFQFDDAFQKGMTELNVLCIERYSLTTLPHPTQSLGKLHTLIIDSCEELETISVVGELVNLEILICRYCESIEELPSEMKGLNSLKVLELTWCSKLQSIGRGIIASLVGLEELKMLGSFDRWEAEDREERENAAITELEALRNLACLEIDILDRSLVTQNMPLLSKKIVSFKIRNNFQPIPSKFSKGMSLRFGRETPLGDWIEMKLLKDTECLYLRGDGASNVDLAKIHQNIRWLELEYCPSMKNVLTTSGGDDATVFFPYIEHLELKSLPELQEICDGPIPSTSFQCLNELQLRDLPALMQIWKSTRVPQNNYVPHFTNLSSIEIRNCGSLRNLGQLSMAGKDCLPQLQELDISFCDMMEQVFLWNDEEAGENQIFITKAFPKLKKVELYHLSNLTNFCQGIQGIEFPVLMEMKFDACPEMKSIIDGSSSANIDEDDSLHLFCQPQKISFGSSLKVLEMDHNPFCHHEIPSSLYNGLESLTINNYEGSMSLFTLTVAANLVSLRELCIENCDEMIKVIEDEEQQQQRILLFPKLEELQLRHLPKLVSFCDSKCEVESPLLREVVICKCPNLEAFTTDLTTCVEVRVDVAFNSLKELEISYNDNPWYDKISVSLFNGLQKLRFDGYEGSVSLLSSSAVGNLVDLRVLRIESCGEIVKVIEDEEGVSGAEIRSVVFPKLEELVLTYLYKLVRFCEWKCDVEFPSLTKLEIRSCPKMETFSMGFVAAPNLRYVEIDGEEIEASKDLNGTLQQYYLAHQVKEINEEEYSSQEKDEIEEDNGQNSDQNSDQNSYWPSQI